MFDDDLGSNSATTTITVTNENPLITRFIAPATLVENESFTINGSFEDEGLNDTAEISIDWGNGDSSLAVVDQQNRTFTASYRYLDDDPTGTMSDIFKIQ